MATTTQRKRLAKSRAKGGGKSGPKKPPVSITFSEATLKAMREVKAAKAEEIATRLIAGNPTLTERFLKLADFAGRGEFLTAELLGSASKAELAAWAAASGIEANANWPKDKIVEAMLASDRLELPKELLQLRPRI